MKKKIIAMVTVAILILTSALILIPSAVSDGGSGTGTRAAADILVVQDGTINGVNGETIFPLLSALTSAGYSYNYVYMATPTSGTNSEIQLDAIPGWDDPSVYPSIFWICGDYYYKSFGWHWRCERPTSTHAQDLANYVQNGGNVFTSGNQVNWHWHYRPNDDYYEWVTHVVCAYNVNGVGGYRSPTYQTDISSSYLNHEIYTTPNIMPSSWTYTHFGPPDPVYGWATLQVLHWGTYQVYLNNGVETGQGYIINPPSSPQSEDFSEVTIYDGREYGAYGRTVFVNRRICLQWDLTDKGDILTPFIQNVAKWFSSGIPADVRLEPQSLNLDSNGNFVQVKVEGFPDNPEYTPLDVDKTSVAVAGVGVDLKYGTWNNNRWIGKADRLLVEDAIGAPGDEVEVEVNGKLDDGVGFFGNAIIKAM